MLFNFNLSIFSLMRESLFTSMSVAKIFARSAVCSASCVVLVPGAAQRSRIDQSGFGWRVFTGIAAAKSWMVKRPSAKPGSDDICFGEWS